MHNRCPSTAATQQVVRETADMTQTAGCIARNNQRTLTTQIMQARTNAAHRSTTASLRPLGKRLHHLIGYIAAQRK
jgi:hypothetical protein